MTPKNETGTPVLGVGIDTSRRRHDVCIKDHDGSILRQMVLRNRVEDVERLVAEIHALRARLGPRRVIVNMEATGVYHRPLYDHLAGLFAVNLWQPKQVKAEDKKNLRRQKTDKRDAKTLANLHATLHPPKTSYPAEEADRFDARELVRTIACLATIRKNLKRRFRRTLFVLYPTWEELFADPYGKTSWGLLKAFPEPALLLDAGPEGVERVMRAAVQRPPRKAAAIVTHVEGMLTARVGASGHAVALRALAEQIDQLGARIAELNEQVQVAWRQEKPRHTFWSHPALTDASSAVVWAEYGELSRFASGDAAVAYAGLENVVYQSGAKRYDGGMSKAGPKLIRTALYACLLPPRKRIPGLTDHMQSMMKRGKPRKVAIHSASKKLVRRLWGMESSKTYFRPS